MGRTQTLIIVTTTAVFAVHCGAFDASDKILARCQGDQVCISRQLAAAKEAQQLIVGSKPVPAKLNECMVKHTEDGNVDWASGMVCYRTAKLGDAR